MRLIGVFCLTISGIEATVVPFLVQAQRSGSTSLSAQFEVNDELLAGIDGSTFRGAVIWEASTKQLTCQNADQTEIGHYVLVNEATGSFTLNDVKRRMCLKLMEEGFVLPVETAVVEAAVAPHLPTCQESNPPAVQVCVGQTVRVYIGDVVCRYNVKPGSSEDAQRAIIETKNVEKIGKVVGENPVPVPQDVSIRASEALSTWADKKSVDKAEYRMIHGTYNCLVGTDVAFAKIDINSMVKQQGDWSGVLNDSEKASLALGAAKYCGKAYQLLLGMPELGNIVAGGPTRAN